MKIDCKNCGHWLIEIHCPKRSSLHLKCICRKCGAVWLEKDDRLRGFRATLAGLEVQEVFGIVVATSRYLHRGHTWAALDHNGRVRIGLDDFSQKVLGPADGLELPEPGQKMRHGRVGLAQVRRGKKAAVLAPLDGTIARVNPKVRQSPALTHDDPYGDGWLLEVTPTNLQPDLKNLLWGQANVAWTENEAHRLLGLLASSAGVTLPSGGTISYDVFGHYPQLGWRRLVQEFLRTG